MTTNPPQIVFNHIVAFEVSKETLVIHTLPDDEQCTIDNKPQAVRRLIKAEIKRNRNKQLCRGVLLRKKVALMQTVIGIGPISAMVVLAYLPDISQLTKGQAARLAGLAPINNDSGKKRGARHVEAGRTAIRRAR
jgi:transposase